VAEPSPLPHPSAKIHPSLGRLADASDPPVKAWVLFADKGDRSPQALSAAIERVAARYNPRATQRRALRGERAQSGRPLFDEHDLPVNRSYVAAVADTGARVHVKSRWLNAVSVYATREQIEAIAGLPFVEKLQPVARSARIPVPDSEKTAAPPTPQARAGGLDYGNAYAQLAQMNLIALHDEGFTGDGVIIGVLDTGFKLTHEAYNHPFHSLNVIAAWDFLNNDPNVGIEPGDPGGQHDHGTKTLSCIGAYKPGSLVGGAFDASFILAKTEDTAGEYPAEEDNFVAGLEFIESNGADLASSSLGYIDWYTQADLDGLTAVTTIAANIFTSHGVHLCNAAGNEYHDSNPNTSSIIAPADGFDVITCGAVTSSGATASFSSDGPTADGRVKPELMALGSNAAMISSSSDTGYTTGSGTSFATPLIASAVGCLVEARPYWTVEQMRQYLFETADYYVANGTYDPLFVRGYGIINAYEAHESACADAGILLLDQAAYPCAGTAGLLVNDCGLNTDDAATEQVSVTVASDSEVAGETVVLTETDPASAEFVGAIPVSSTDGPGILWVAEGDTVTATYIDANDGQGGVDVFVTDTAIVDCTPPQITNVQTGNLEPRSVAVTILADESVRGTVDYGLACGNWTGSEAGSAFGNPAIVNLSGLQDETSYFYAVTATDEAGNSSSDDNGGTCYSFTTPDIPNFFTEAFGSGFDLDGWSLTFTPNGSVDFYAGCAEEITALPTDPAGGTNLSLSDDDWEAVNLGGGTTVSLYGTNYGTLYPGSNGYVTFGSGDSDYTESLDDHFDLPRIAALFDDLNPSSGGTVSWKQLADRAAVTWQGVPEYSATGSNTFQIEMFFDGVIRISYLGITGADGIAGLSEGNGLSPDFFTTDLSAMGPCGPRPPVATGSSVGTAVATPVTIALDATDDGLPDPPAALVYIIAGLPGNGSLSDPGAGPITAAPYELVGGGNQVVYQSDPGYHDVDTFTFKANDGGVAPDGGDSNTAIVAVTNGGPSWDPVAYDVSDSTGMNLPKSVTLVGTDPNGDPLRYVIESLPADGYLSDPGAGAITTVPYELVGSGNVVLYQPPCGLILDDSFTFSVHDLTAGSDIAAVQLHVAAGPPEAVYRFLLDSDPGWSTEGDWAFGVPTGGGSHSGDPVAGHTGTSVYGYNLNGDYPPDMTAPMYLTSEPLDCSLLNGTEVRFWRQLGVDGNAHDHATFEVSADGANWTLLWSNPATPIDERGWLLHVNDISGVADGASTVTLRWGMGPTDSTTEYPGWNIDDLEIWAVLPATPSDFDGNGQVGLGDYALFEACMWGPDDGQAPTCLCKDLDGDGDIDLADFAMLQAAFAG
jgi:hypothetical protein